MKNVLLRKCLFFQNENKKQFCEKYCQDCKQPNDIVMKILDSFERTEEKGWKAGRRRHKRKKRIEDE